MTTKELLCQLINEPIFYCDLWLNDVCPVFASWIEDKAEIGYFIPFETYSLYRLARLFFKENNTSPESQKKVLEGLNNLKYNHFTFQWK